MTDKTIKVLMMGGRRCGKTSVLASIFHEMTDEHSEISKINEIFTVTNQTDYNNPNQPKIHLKREELEDFIKERVHSIFLVDEKPTKSSWTYKLQLRIPGTNKSMHIEFMDVEGEYFEEGNINNKKIRNYINEGCSVFVVVIDTPYLMSDKGQEARLANLPQSIKSFLVNIDETDRGDAEPKQIIFVPVKCEKWVKEKKIDDVVQKVKEYYSGIIDYLKARGRMEISIIPIQTAGDIIFDNLRDPYIYVDEKTNETVKCSKISDRNRTVMRWDGKRHSLTDAETLNPDPEGVFCKTKITRRAEWFTIESSYPQYSPHNCAQIPLHILRFMFNKLKSKAHGGLLGWLASFLFGSVTAGDMQRSLNDLAKNGLIKDTGEGIEVIRSFRVD